MSRDLIIKTVVCIASMAIATAAKEHPSTEVCGAVDAEGADVLLMRGAELHKAFDMDEKDDEHHAQKKTNNTNEQMEHEEAVSWDTSQGCLSHTWSGSHDQLTIKFKLRLTQLTTHLMSVFSNNGWNTGSLHLNVKAAPNGNLLEFAINGNKKQVFSGFTLGKNTEYDVTITYNKPDKSAKLYINGVLKDEFTLPFAHTVVGTSGQIGCYQGNRLLQGSIKDFRFIYAVTAPQQACDETLSGTGDRDYRGCQTVTTSGKTCQAWNVQTPHAHGNTPASKPTYGLDSNYCRNPDGESTIWCYTRE